MKILLTGNPKSGKTTLLYNFLEAVPNKLGFVTKETLTDGVRTSFELVSSTGKRAMFASVDSDSTVRVSRYGVDVQRLDTFISELPPVNNESLLYVDEIGQMQLYSDTFKTLVTNYLAAGSMFVGTVSKVYEDDFTKQVMGLPDAVVLIVDPDNWHQLQAVLNGLAANITLITKLDIGTQRQLVALAKEYAAATKYIPLRKLFKNAIKYVAEDRVIKTASDAYIVQGDTNDHVVKKVKDAPSCDCALFKGSGSFAGNPGECSHIQAVKLIERSI